MLCPGEAYSDQQSVEESLLNNKENNITVLLACSLLSLGIFIFDLFMPLGVAAAVPYVAVVLLSRWLPERKHTLLIGMAVSILTVLAIFMKSYPAVAQTWVWLTNRSISLLGIWAAVVFVSLYKGALDVIKEQQAALKKEEGALREVNHGVSSATTYTKEGQRDAFLTALFGMKRPSACRL